MSPSPLNVLGFTSDKAFDYENGFYLTSDPRRLGKLLAHFELYKRILHLPGHVLECGVFKGASLIRWAAFREGLESPWSRKIVGFDAFGAFPKQPNETDEAYARRHDQFAGQGISLEGLQDVLAHKGYANIELVPGDILDTVPRYVQQHPELKIALLHIDVDVYAPTRTCMEHLYDRLVPGGVLVLDDYGTVEGETRAVDEFFAGKGVAFQKLGIGHIPAFVVKPA